jgi:hypothetical protein
LKLQAASIMRAAFPSAGPVDALLGRQLAYLEGGVKEFRRRLLAGGDKKAKKGAALVGRGGGLE